MLSITVYNRVGGSGLTECRYDKKGFTSIAWSNSCTFI